MNTFHFHILTLNGVVYEGDIVNVYVNTLVGMLGCLPGRTPIVAGLKPEGSVFKFQEESGRTRYFVTLGGAFEMKVGEAFLLSEKCEEVKSYDEGKTALEKLKKEKRKISDNSVLKAQAEILSNTKSK